MEKKRSDMINNQFKKSKVKSAVFLKVFLMFLQEIGKNYQSVFALRAFLFLFFKHPFKNCTFLFFSA